MNNVFMNPTDPAGSGSRHVPALCDFFEIVTFRIGVFGTVLAGVRCRRGYRALPLVEHSVGNFAGRVLVLRGSPWRALSHFRVPCNDLL